MARWSFHKAKFKKIIKEDHVLIPYLWSPPPICKQGSAHCHHISFFSQQLLQSSHTCCSHPAVWAHLWRTSLSNRSPTYPSQSGQTNLALIARKNNTTKISLEFVSFWTGHMVFSSTFSWLITVIQLLNKDLTSLTALLSWSHMLIVFCF